MEMVTSDLPTLTRCVHVALPRKRAEISRRFRAAALLFLLAGTASAQTIPDGSTDTNVTINANGSVTVGIAAPVANGVSLNRYDSFDVPRPGLELDNRVPAARTIVNEVTGTGATTIAGEVRVLGQRAHVIVANPNGIVVEGGRFVNTGRVALTTGRISTVPQQIAPGVFQQNVRATVTGGTITVAGGGLSGQMDAVNLIARDLMIGGPVTNSNAADAAALRLSAGATITDFNSAVLPGNASLTWGSTTATGASSTGTLIRLVRLGALTANQIGILVNDAGAGVHFADGQASARNFVLNADGDIRLDGTAIAAGGSARITGGNVQLGTPRITAPTGILSVASTTGDIAFTTGEVIANALLVDSARNLRFSGLTAAVGMETRLTTAQDIAIDDSALATQGPVLVAARDLALRGDTTQSTLASEQSATIVTLDGDLSVVGGLLQGRTGTVGLVNQRGTAATGAVTLSVAGDIDLSNTDHLAVIFGADGDVAIAAGGDMTNAQGRIIANGDVALTVGGALDNSVARPAGTISAFQATTAVQKKRLWWSLGLLSRERRTTILDSGFTGPDLTLPIINASGAITVTAAEFSNLGGALNANGGDLTITANGVTNAAVATGSVRITDSCTLVCKSTIQGGIAVSGGTLNAARDLTIRASRSLDMTGGSALGLRNVTLDSPQIAVAALTLPVVIARPAGLHNFWKSDSYWVAGRTDGGTVSAQTGQITATSANPLRLTGGALNNGGSTTVDFPTEIVQLPDPGTLLSADDIGLLGTLPFLRN